MSAHGPGGRAWLADETAIDFPSVAAEVDTMTSAFVAVDPAPALTADVRLTARQAFEGTALPLDVPVRCTCRACGGRGEQFPDVCPACEGSGVELRTHPVRVLVPARVRDGARFRFVVAPRQHPETRIELRVSVA
ncbi:MAG: hypothetical protein AB7I25_08085 [Vicinamibacterales bacterium]